MNPRDLAGNAEELGRQKKKKRMVNPRDLAGNAEELGRQKKKKRMVNPRDLAGNAEELGRPKKKKRMVNPRDLAGKAEELGRQKKKKRTVNTSAKIGMRQVGLQEHGFPRLQTHHVEEVDAEGSSVPWKLLVQLQDDVPFLTTDVFFSRLCHRTHGW